MVSVLYSVPHMITSLSNQFADAGLGYLQAVVAGVKDLMDKIGLGGLVTPVLKMLQDSIQGVRDFVVGTGAFGYGVLLLTSVSVILMLVRE